MSVPLPSQTPALLSNSLSGVASQKLAVAVAATIGLILLVAFYPSKRTKYPVANPPGAFIPQSFAQFDFLRNGREIFLQAKKRFNGRTYRLFTELGDTIVLPPAYAHEIRNEANLSFTQAVVNDFHASIPGFEPFGLIAHDKQIVQKVARKQLTKFLNTVTEPLSDEATFAVDLILGQSLDWKEIPIKDAILDIVSRLSSRVFLGNELCRNEDWLYLTKNYTVDGFKAAAAITFMPPALKFFVRWFSKDVANIRKQLKQAMAIVDPVIKRRHASKEEAKAEGKPIPKYNDAIEWAELESEGASYDPAMFQLLLSFAAIHTTSELVSKFMTCLAAHPQYYTPLREEIISVLKAEGWKKSALFNMKLLDSALKETQRWMPDTLINMRRIATKDVTLPDGTTIPKGQRCEVDSSSTYNPDIYENPEVFDIYRFRRMRETADGANKAQLVSTSPDHIAFGHGMHACPGRFFASNESKIIMCHLLLKFDWKLAPGTRTEPLRYGISQIADPGWKLMFRRRKEEINLGSLEFA